MEVELYEINVTLSKYQKEKIRNAFINREKIFLRLKDVNLNGSDTLLVPEKPLKRLKDVNLNIIDYVERIEDNVEINNVEGWENGIFFVNSKADEKGLFDWVFRPTVVERLESKRKEEYKGMQILLDYSLINNLTKDSVSQNIEKLFK